MPNSVEYWQQWKAVTREGRLPAWNSSPVPCACRTSSFGAFNGPIHTPYFNVHGGLGEPIRLALHIGGIAFEDKRLGFAEFAEVRKTSPLNQVPVLHLEGVQVTQSNAITRCAGKLAGLYPTDAFQVLLRRGDGWTGWLEAHLLMVVMVARQGISRGTK